MQLTPHAYSRPEPAQPELATIPTTLRELIEAIEKEVEPKEDHLVGEVVLHLLDTGRIRFLNPRGELELLWLS
ncbi:MAG: hypothetical protein PVJ69_12550 [Desulfobacteraceae bacterium]|jgi:hypothetical protein